MKLYKYVSSKSALLNIVNGKIKFATLESLNDPTELLPKIYDEELLTTLEDKRKNGYTEDDLIDLKQQEILFKKLSPETMVFNAPKSIEAANSIVNLSVYNNIDYLKKMFNETVELMGSRCGIFCVSTRYNSLPMWAHYANNASGFVLEFKNLDNIYTGDGTGILNEVRDVIYKNKRSGINFKKGSYNSLFFEKDKDWEYESEKRIITDLSNCTQLKIGDGVIYLQDINKNHISKVIFGWRTSEQMIDKLSNEILNINPNLELATAKIEHGMIELK